MKRAEAAKRASKVLVPRSVSVPLLKSLLFRQGKAILMLRLGPRGFKNTHPHPTAGGREYRPLPCPERGDQRTEDRGIGPRGFKNQCWSFM